LRAETIQNDVGRQHQQRLASAEQRNWWRSRKPAGSRSSTAAATNEVGGAHSPTEEEHNDAESQPQQRLAAAERCDAAGATAGWLLLQQHCCRPWPGNSAVAWNSNARGATLWTFLL